MLGLTAILDIEWSSNPMLIGWVANEIFTGELDNEIECVFVIIMEPRTHSDDVHVCLFIFAVRPNECLPPPYLEGGSLLNWNQTVGGMGILKCAEGKRFPDGTQEKTVLCNGEEWVFDMSMFICIGKRCSS